MAGFHGMCILNLKKWVGGWGLFFIRKSVGFCIGVAYGWPKAGLVLLIFYKEKCRFCMGMAYGWPKAGLGCCLWVY